ncbi:MAG: Na(+)-translocating NADH-quinone reductase subunit A [Bacteroidales bacterium]|nr:Na(+)-translocating NADH-quinone reductase subunit A [Bacteroidales bacterium]
MSEVIRIRKGLNIKIYGEASRTVHNGTALEFALKPTDFNGVFPKLLLQEGDPVQVGTPIFFDKYRDYLLFTSPVSGTFREIRRGPKRVILELRIEPDGKDRYVSFAGGDPVQMSREDITVQLLKSGIWLHIRQRPYSIIANPKDDPKAIHISAFDTHPLAPDCDLVVEGQEKVFQTGLNALKRLTSGIVHLNLDALKTKSPVFLNATGVQLNRFTGPHPAGNVGIQIHHIDPINKGDIVWYLNPQAVITIGRLFLEGRYDPSRIIALTGSEVTQPSYYRVTTGMGIQNLVKGNTTSGQNRFISGNVLTGTRIERQGYLGFYDYQLTVIPEGEHHRFFGWAMPGLDRFSFSRSFPSWLLPKRKYRLDTNLNGGRRAFVMTGEFEKVFPMDIYPLQLIKAIMIEDIDLMEQLGIYEVDEEDFALCEFVDTSKTSIQDTVRKGLDLIRKEMS